MILMPKAIQNGHRIEQHLCLRDLDCRTPQRQHALSEKLPAQPALHIPSVFAVMRWQPVIHYELYRNYGSLHSLSLRVFVCQVFGSFSPLLQRYQESFFTAFTYQRCPSWRDVVYTIYLKLRCCEFVVILQWIVCDSKLLPIQISWLTQLGAAALDFYLVQKGRKPQTSCIRLFRMLLRAS